MKRKIIAIGLLFTLIMTVICGCSVNIKNFKLDKDHIENTLATNGFKQSTNNTYTNGKTIVQIEEPVEREVFENNRDKSFELELAKSKQVISSSKSTSYYVYLNGAHEYGLWNNNISLIISSTDDKEIVDDLVKQLKE